MKQTLFRILFILFLYLSIEFVSLVSLFGYSKFRNQDYNPIVLHLSKSQKDVVQRLISSGGTYEGFDPLLGWSLIPNKVIKSTGWQVNSQGLRGDRDYHPQPAEGTLRIMAFGDSFTHGNEVSNTNTWAEILQRIDRRLEVMNFGVSAYGLDQAYLRYKRDGKKFQGHLVFIGYMSYDIYRNVSVFHLFKNLPFPLTKPRFEIQNNELKLMENPFQKLSDYEAFLKDDPSVFHSLGKKDIYFNHCYHENSFDFLPSVRLFKIAKHAEQHTTVMDKILTNGVFDTSSEAYQITIRILSRFYSDVENSKMIPVILLFPSKEDLRGHKRFRPLMYQPLVDYCVKQKYRFIDLNEAFENISANDLNHHFVTSHFSPAGNQLVAERILKFLKQNDLLTANGAVTFKP
jgi:hypothetical protein